MTSKNIDFPCPCALASGHSWSELLLPFAPLSVEFKDGVEVDVRQAGGVSIQCLASQAASVAHAFLLD